MKLRFGPFLLVAVFFAVCSCKEAKKPASSETPKSTPSPAQVAGNTSSSSAQGQGSGRRQQRLKEIQANIGLTDDQTQKISAILLSMQPAIQAVRENKTLTPEQRIAKWEDLHLQVNAKVAPLLTPEQKVKWDAEHQRWRERIAQRHGNSGIATEAVPATIPEESASPSPSSSPASMRN